MRFKYVFIEDSDIISSEALNVNSFYDFLQDLNYLNEFYYFNIYMEGDYLTYLSNKSNNYGNIKFYISSEKILDLSQLADFMLEFHKIAKGYNFLYDLVYLVNTQDEDIHLSDNTYNPFRKRRNKVIRLYKDIISLDCEKINLKQNYYNFRPVKDSILFEGVMSHEFIGYKEILMRQINTFHHKPIKIT
jgi:hypothetical protein